MYRVIIFLLLRLMLPSLIFISVAMQPYAVVYADGGDSDGDGDGDSDSDGDGGDDDGDSGDDDGSSDTNTEADNSAKSHQRSIRKAVQQKQILPLSEIKRIVQAKTGSEIIGIELERKSRGWVYEFKTVDSRGRLREIYVDAASGSILRYED